MDSLAAPTRPAAAELEAPLTKLHGENRDGDLVSGSDFWRVGASGAAGSYSSNAGGRTRVVVLLAPAGAADVAGARWLCGVCTRDHAAGPLADGDPIPAAGLAGPRVDRDPGRVVSGAWGALMRR